MAVRTTILCLLLLVVGCLSVNFTVTGDITPTSTVNFSIPGSNLYDYATLTINHAAAVTVCLTEKYENPAGNQFSNDTCTFFYNFSGTTNHVELPLRSVKYFVGIFYADLSNTNHTHVEVTVLGKYCDDQFYYDAVSDPVGCRLATTVAAGNVKVEVKDGKLPITHFYEFNAGDLLGFLSVKRTNEAATPAFIRLRYEGTPSAELYDANDLLGSAKFVTPRPGKWVIGFEAHEAGTYNFDIAVEDCKMHPGFAGEGCTTPYFHAEDNMTLVAYPGIYTYFRYDATSSSPLNVSVTTLKKTDIPYLVVSKGNLPTLENADVLNCNQEHCDVVHSVRVKTTAAVGVEVWFIGVTASVHEGNTTYGIWFNSTCAPECETDNHGTCNDDGTCSCQLDFTGIDCSKSTGLGAQYIVLIIIASLVVASAIIGFVAWAYMRRKRVNYELVS